MKKKSLDDSTDVRLYFLGYGSFISVNVTWILNTNVINSIYTLILEDEKWAKYSQKFNNCLIINFGSRSIARNKKMCCSDQMWNVARRRIQIIQII